MIQLSNESFTNLCKALDIVSQFCTDASIKSNQIRQMSDDKVVILHVNVPESIQDMNLADIKRKLKIMSLFSDAEQIGLNVTPNVISITDTITEVTFAHPPDDVLINAYMSDEEFNSKIAVDKLVNFVNQTLDETTVVRLNKLAEIFNTRKVELIPNGSDKYDIHLAAQDKSHKAAINSVQTNQILGKLSFSTDVFSPFSSACTIELYYLSDNPQWILAKISGLIDNINLTLYSRVGVEV